jgi:hypothetical protein
VSAFFNPVDGSYVPIRPNVYFGFGLTVFRRATPFTTELRAEGILGSVVFE